MEKIPQAANDNERSAGYDREVVAREAMQTANELLTERGVDQLLGNERFDVMVSLMQELAEDNRNRHVVEALAQKLTVEKADHNAWVTSEQYPMAKAAA